MTIDPQAQRQIINRITAAIAHDFDNPHIVVAALLSLLNKIVAVEYGMTSDEAIHFVARRLGTYSRQLRAKPKPPRPPKPPPTKRQMWLRRQTLAALRQQRALGRVK